MREVGPVVATLGACLIIAACGGPTERVELSNHAPQRPRPVCTDDVIAELTTRLGERWQIGPLEIRCVGGRFPELGLFVEARWSNVRRVGILGLDRKREIVPFVELVAERTVRPVMKELLVADIDGNGIDEVVDAWRHEQYAASGDRMVVWATKGLALERIDGPYLNAFRPGLGGCRARAEVSEHGVEITVRTSHGLSPIDCLRSGRHRFVIVAGRMVQLERKGDLPPPPTPAPVSSTVPSIFSRTWW